MMISVFMMYLSTSAFLSLCHIAPALSIISDALGLPLLFYQTNRQLRLLSSARNHYQNELVCMNNDAAK